MAVGAVPSTPQVAFWRGVLASLPVSVGIVPFGLITGIAGIKAGLNTMEVTLMSGLVLAGAAQLVALQLMGAGASIFFVWLATLVVNLRYLMYSSALAKPLEALSGRMKLLAAFLMVDQNFALALNQYGTLGPRLTPWFYLGIGGCSGWAGWLAPISARSWGRGCPKSGRWTSPCRCVFWCCWCQRYRTGPACWLPWWVGWCLQP